MTNQDQTSSSLLPLRRFCYLRNEAASYAAGKHTATEEYKPHLLTCFNELERGLLNTIITNTLADLAKEGLAERVALANVLAQCVSEDRDGTQKVAYGALPVVCQSSSTLFLFIKLCKDIAKQNNKGVWGKACRKGISKWYSSKDPTTLANILIAEKEAFGWTHRDILKLIHYKPPSPLIDAVIKVFAFGKEDATTTLNDDLKFLAEGLKELKITEDAQRAAFLLKKLKLTPNHIPFRFRESTDLWIEFAKQLPTSDLLKRLEFLTTNKALASKLIPAVTAILEDADGTKLDPAETYFALRHYEICASHARRERAIEKAQLTAVGTKGKSKEKTSVKACPKVLAAVQRLLMDSLKVIPAGDVRWLIVTDIIGTNQTNLQSLPGVSSACAAALLTNYIIRSSKSATVMTFEGNVEFNPEDTISQMAAKLRDLVTDRKVITTVMEKAINEKMEADAIVVITDQKKGCAVCLQSISTAVETYRTKMNLPQTKLAVVFLKCTELLTCEEPNLFVVRNFDARVPKLVDAFSKGKF